MEHHEELLAKTVTIVATLPEAGPFAQGVGVVGGATSHGLVDAEFDFNDAGGPLLSWEMADGDDFSHEDNAGEVGHLVEGCFDRLREGACLLSLCGDGGREPRGEEADDSKSTG
jgi:hypothetical protein